MPKAYVPPVDTIIASTINETARGDPEELASRIVAALAEAGYSIVPRGRMHTTRYSCMHRLYRSSNGDVWFLARHPETGAAFIRHQANAASGGQVTHVEIDDFLSGPQSPERDALLRAIGSLIIDPQGAEAEEEPPVMNPNKEWSDAELKEVGDMLLRGCSIEEIARLLRRDYREVQNKVAEVGRACR